MALNKNVLINPGAEAGPSSSDGNSPVSIPGWQGSLGFTVVEYGTSGFPGVGSSAAIHGGAQFFTAGHDLVGLCGQGWQDVSVASRAGQVDGGHLRAGLKADMGTYAIQTDNAGAKLQFLDAGKKLIRAESTQLVSKTSNAFKPMAAVAVIPAGTRFIRVLLYTTQHQGSYCDAYFDNLSLTLRTADGFRSVVAGQQHSCAIRSDTTVWCWGGDLQGQLGDGTRGDKFGRRLRPVEVTTSGGAPFKGAVQLALGTMHSCALTSTGVIWCWGGNFQGQLGDGTLGDQGVRLHPVRVRHDAGFLTGITEITGLGTATCALKNDGHVWCWGSDGSGELGDGTFGDQNYRRLKPVRVRTNFGLLPNVRHIGSGTSHACAVKSNTEVWCWGADALGQLGDGHHSSALNNSNHAVPVLGQAGHLQHAVSVDGGAGHTCARISNGTISCWGSDGYGQLGDGTKGDAFGLRQAPVKVKVGASSLSGVASITLGDYSTCAVMTAGGVYCWGYDALAQLGDGTTGDGYHVRLTPGRVVMFTGKLLANVTGASAGFGHVCAVRSKGAPDGTIWCWGENATGQVGDGTRGNANYLSLKAAQTNFH